MALLEVKDIKKQFNGVLALNKVELRCESGKITGLLGANGSGKSTLSKIITGVYKLDSGTMVFKGKQIRFSSPAESKKNGISMVFQNLSTVEDLTVWQNIVLGCENQKGLFLNNTSDREKAEKILSELSDGIDLDNYLYQLSPSEMQIVEIAKALITDPELLILDEPTASLENNQVERLFAYMKKLAAQNVAMIFTSHRMKEVMEMCDEVYVFKDGENAGYLDFSKDERDEDRVVQMITGRKLSDFSKQIDRSEFEDSKTHETMFKVQNLKYLEYLRNISLEVKKGEVLGIGGLSGQGQEELMLALAGNYSKLDGGTFILEGEKISLKSPADAIAKGIFLVPGDRRREGLFASHSLYNNIIYPKLGCKGESLFIKKKEYSEMTNQIMKSLSIATLHGIETPVNTLSGGNAQKVVVGKWLGFDTKVMLLSDPAKGVDVGAKEDMYVFIRNMVKEKQNSAIVYASDVDELIRYCDRVLIMYEGRIIAELCGSDVNEEKIYATSITGKESEKEAVL